MKYLLVNTDTGEEGNGSELLESCKTKLEMVILIQEEYNKYSQGHYIVGHHKSTS